VEENFPVVGVEGGMRTFVKTQLTKISERTSLQGVKPNTRPLLDQRPPWQPDLLLHFTRVSTHTTRLVWYVSSI